MHSCSSPGSCRHFRVFSQDIPAHFHFDARTTPSLVHEIYVTVLACMHDLRFISKFPPSSIPGSIRLGLDAFWHLFEYCLDRGINTSIMEIGGQVVREPARSVTVAL